MHISGDARFGYHISLSGGDTIAVNSISSSVDVYKFNSEYNQWKTCFSLPYGNLALSDSGLYLAVVVMQMTQRPIMQGLLRYTS